MIMLLNIQAKNELDSREQRPEDCSAAHNLRWLFSKGLDVPERLAILKNNHGW
jgi:hypothetical protein